MSILDRKDLVKLITSFVSIGIVALFYFLSPLLSNVFNGTVILIITLIPLITLVSQIIFDLIKKEKISKIFKVVNEYIQIVLIAAIIIEFVFTFIMFPATVSQNSMRPTLFPEDRLLISRTKEVDNNDIIVFEYDNTIQKNNVGVRNKELLIKRVIAKGGQTFKYVGKNLYIDGVFVEDKFAVENMNGLTLKDICEKNGMTEQCLQEDGSYIIPEGWFVVFGDNRQYSNNNVPVSIDSRAFGLVHESQIYGKVEYRILSIFKWVKM